MSNQVAVPAKPTRLLIEKNAQGVMTKGRIEEATLAYVRLQDGELSFGSETERNYAVQMVVTKETARNFKSVFSKNGYREMPNEQFTKTFKIDPPYPEQEDQYVLKLKSNTTFNNDIPERNIKAGDLVPYEAASRPKLYEIVEGKPVDITMTVRPANGSKGVVAFRIAENKFGTFPSLTGVVVTDLIESQQRASMESDFGITADTPSTNRKALPAPAQNNNEPEDNEPQSHDSAQSENDWF
jgi:hypothetical protein